jgi:hypothetical protein
MEIDLFGPFPKTRAWLRGYLKTARFKNDLITDVLLEDWSGNSHTKCAYLVGVIWGRLRQMDQSLETATVYSDLVGSELEEQNTEAPASQ